MRTSYGWVVVALGALMTCVAVGAMFSLAVFLQPITEATGWSRAGVSSAMTLNFLMMGLAGFAWGTLSDRFGPRIVVLAGGVLLGLGLLLASRATSQLEFQLVYGLIVGTAAGSFIFARRLEEFYAVAIVFGFAYGGVMPLYAALAREYFSQNIMAAILGAAMMISSLGMALGPSAGSRRSSSATCMPICR